MEPASQGAARVHSSRPGSYAESGTSSSCCKLTPHARAPQSDVLSVKFSPFHSNLIIGGSYSGQILQWDTTLRQSNPKLQTPLSAVGHTHPIYSLTIVGTQNAHNIVSASTDGTVCSWALNKFSEPTEKLELTHHAHVKTDEVSVTALGFPDNETGFFWVGTEEGNVYAASRFRQGGAQPGLVQSEVYRGHQGPVTGVDFHPVAGAVDLSDLFLTSGVDWTVKLWRKGATGASSAAVAAAAASGASSTAGGAGGRSAAAVASAAVKGATGAAGGPHLIKPVLSFENADEYVYDVKWHPHHPALFGSVDGEGKFDLWNLNEDTEVRSGGLSSVACCRHEADAAPDRSPSSPPWSRPMPYAGSTSSPGIRGKVDARRSGRQMARSTSMRSAPVSFPSPSLLPFCALTLDSAFTDFPHVRLCCRTHNTSRGRVGSNAQDVQRGLGRWQCRVWWAVSRWAGERRSFLSRVVVRCIS